MMPMPRTTGDPIVPTPPATTLSYDQSAQLMTDPVFRGRVKVACIDFAQSIFIEANTTPAHTSRLKWAQGCYNNPDMVAAQVQSPVVMDPGVQEAGSAITDAALQASVEAVIQKFL